MDRIKEIIEKLKVNANIDLIHYFRIIERNDVNDYIKLCSKFSMWEKGIPFAVSVFGEVLALTDDNYIILYKFMNNDSKVLIENCDKFVDYINDIEIQKEYFYIDLYKEVEKKFEKLKNNESYIFEPIPALGGDMNINSANIGNTKVYIDLISQLLLVSNK